jgi:prepilin-type N-terminal cleavage/methylation domain-containing protein
MKRTAFTLPEILITLGAIGIVAAITIPVLFSNINNVKFRNQYKKSSFNIKPSSTNGSSKI